MTEAIYLLASKKLEPKQELGFEMAQSQFVDPQRVMGRLAMTPEQEDRFEVVGRQFEKARHMVGQLTMELQLVIPEPDQQ